MSNPATKITMSTQYFSQMDLSLRFIVWERFTLGLSVDLDFIVQKSSKKQGKGKVPFFPLKSELFFFTSTCPLLLTFKNWQATAIHVSA